MGKWQSVKFPHIVERLRRENPDKDDDWIHKEYIRIAKSPSYECLIEKYGIEGADEYRKKLSKGHTLEGQIAKYGLEEGTKRYNSFLKSKGVNLPNQIKKYGEELGRIKYQESVNNRKNTLENMIKRHGEEEGKLRYDQYVLRSKNTVDNFIRVYGEEEGKKRYRLYVKKIAEVTKPYSKISKELFDELVKRLNLDKSEVFYAENESNFTVTFPSGMEMEVRVDFYWKPKKKVIEFLGDYWHKNVNKFDEVTDEIMHQFNWDLDRFKAIEDSEYCNSLDIVWESEYQENKEQVVERLIKFLTDGKN